jgi:hypothetical protein
MVMMNIINPWISPMIPLQIVRWLFYSLVLFLLPLAVKQEEQLFGCLQV